MRHKLKGKPLAKPPSKTSAPANRRWPLVVVPLVLFGLIWFIFGQTLYHDFVNLDDAPYVYKNPRVSGGLQLSSIIWAFTHSHSSNWHPLTWISHMLDCQFYGLNAGGHHLTNLLLHAANAVLLFFVLRFLTGTLWRSAATAALFAVHPLRVESVAWVAERKDLLSGLFFLLTLWAYARYVRAGRTRRAYVWVMALFALGLLCKPMLVTLPPVLLLLDYWPLDRMKSADGGSFGNIKRLVIEKIPLALMALMSCVATIVAQESAVQPLAVMSLPLRLGNALMACATYIRQMFWPRNLAAFYPLTFSDITAFRVIGSLLLLVAISVFVFVLRRKRYLVAGWLWYLVMLAPVIGIVQVGSQAHADRYTYLPEIGLVLLLVWGATDLIRSRPVYRTAVASIALAIITGLTLLAHAQAAAWKDSESLWTQTLARTSKNLMAELDLGQAVYQLGRPHDAIDHFDRALQINQNQASVHSSLGVALLEVGRARESLAHLQTAVALDSHNADAHYNLGNTLLALAQPAEAVAEYERALAINPDDTECLNNLAWILATSPDPLVRDGPKALARASHADSLTRGASPVIAATLAAAYAENGLYPDAIKAAERAIRLALGEGNQSRADSIRSQMKFYEAATPFRDRRSQR